MNKKNELILNNIELKNYKNAFIIYEKNNPNKLKLDLGIKNLKTIIEINYNGKNYDYDIIKFEININNFKLRTDAYGCLEDNTFVKIIKDIKELEFEKYSILNQEEFDTLFETGDNIWKY